MKNAITTPTQSFLTRGLMPALLATAILSFGPASTARADGDKDNHPHIFPIQSHPYGKAYGEWSGAWWRWAYSIPADINPVMDSTGQNAGVGQSGPVWFLAGAFGTGATERTVTLPAGKALFFPIANEVWVNLPAFGDNPWSPAQDVLARSIIGDLMNAFVTLTCQIDGRPVPNLSAYRCQTPAGEDYMVTFPDNNVLQALGWLPGLTAGTYGPSVDDGYYLMLAPLAAGKHTLHFTAANADGSFSLDVTYHLTVQREHHGADK